MKLNNKRTVALSTLGVLTASTFAGAFITPAQADAKTWKKVAIGAGAVTAYGLLKHNGKATTLGGIATVGSYLKYKSDKKKETKAEAKRQQWYKARYGRLWRNHYKAGA